MEKATRSMENLIKQVEGDSSEDLPMCKLLSLDKQLKSIWGSLKVETAKKVKLKQLVEQEKHKLEEIQDNLEHDDGIQKGIWKRIESIMTT